MGRGMLEMVCDCGMNVRLCFNVYTPSVYFHSLSVLWPVFILSYLSKFIYNSEQNMFPFIYILNIIKQQQNIIKAN